MVIVGPASWNRIVEVPELPAGRPQTLFAGASWTTLGGTSAGKALHLAQLGVEVLLHTVVGDDLEADQIRSALDDPHIRLVTDRVDGRSEQHLNLMAGGDRVSIYLWMPSAPVGPLPAEVTTPLTRAQHVVLDLSDRAKSAIPAAAAGTATIWTDLHDYDGASEYHAPFLSAADVVFFSSDAIGDPRELMTRLINDGKRLVVCTLGARGAIAVDQGGWYGTQAIPTRVVDTNGAGDGFFAGFLAATLSGSPVDQALHAGAAQAVNALTTRHLCSLLESDHMVPGPHSAESAVSNFPVAPSDVRSL